MRRSTRLQLAQMAREPERQPGRKMEIEYETWGEPEQRYDRQPRSNWREPTRMGGYGPESREGRMNYGEDAEMRRGRRGGARSEMEMGGYEPESRFRDRRGREHYDNGRFAPMRGSYAPEGPYGNEDGPFGRDERGGDGMRPIGFNSNWGGEMRMGADATVPRYREMERMPGNRAMMGGYMAEHGGYPKMDERTAMEWVKSMHNEDGTKTPHWTMDQVKQVVKQKGITGIELPELFAVMNALYSDYDPVFKRHNVSNMEMYVDMAKAWIMDEDAVENKATAYWECIVKPNL